MGREVRTLGEVKLRNSVNNLIMKTFLIKVAHSIRRPIVPS